MSAFSGISKALVIAAVAVLLLVFVEMRYFLFISESGTSREHVERSSKPTPLSSAKVAEGRAVYESNCVRCHGPKGRRSPNWRIQNPDKTFPPPPHDSSGHTWHHSDKVLFQIIHDGGKIFEDQGFKSAMPAFGDRLGTGDIEAVMTYLKSLWGPTERSVQAEESAKD